jgi:hypothetical protein
MRSTLEDRSLYNRRCENLKSYKVHCVTLRYKSWYGHVSYVNCLTLRHIVDPSRHAVLHWTSHSASLHMMAYRLGQCTHHVSSRGKQRHQHFNTAPDRGLVVCIIFLFLLRPTPLCQSALEPHPGVSPSPGASPPASTGSWKETAAVEENTRIPSLPIMFTSGLVNKITVWYKRVWKTSDRSLQMFVRNSMPPCLESMRCVPP